MICSNLAFSMLAGDLLASLTNVSMQFMVGFARDAREGVHCSIGRTARTLVIPVHNARLSSIVTAAFASRLELYIDLQPFSRADKASAFANLVGARLKMFRNAAAASVNGDTVISPIISFCCPNCDVDSLNDVSARCAAASKTPSDGVLESQFAYFPRSRQSCDKKSGFFKEVEEDFAIANMHLLIFSSWCLASEAILGASSDCVAKPKCCELEALAAASCAAGLAFNKRALLEASTDTAQRQKRAASIWNGVCAFGAPEQNSSMAMQHDSI
mmetsp:Transcript_28105/g.43061  ORF Transcript_28105/g.43061 Transcript_28105/m.43061 type:complete len:272 (-) Transcript_28105:1734-2549(-)